MKKVVDSLEKKILILAEPHVRRNNVIHCMANPQVMEM